MSNKPTVTEDALNAAQTAVAFAGALVLVKWYFDFCLWISPRRSRPMSAILIAIALPFLVYGCLKIFGSPPSHPSSHYSPVQWRELVQRKCIAELDQYNGVQMDIACVALDAPDVPIEVRNQFTSLKYAEDQYDLLFVSRDHVNIERYRSNDPGWFEHPEMRWANHTKPGVSVLQFWDWSML